jgi:PAS domain S-box-containing protein
VIFLFDITTPISLAVWTLYLLPLFLTVYVRQRLAPFSVAFTVIVLDLAGIINGYPDVPIVNTLFNRVFFSAVIVVLAFFIWNYRKNQSALEERTVDLRRSHELLENHIGNSPLAIIEFDAQFRIARWTGDATRIFGWSPEEVIGKAIGEFPWVYKEDAERVTAISADMLDGKSSRNKHANRNYRKDGTVIFCEWYNSALRDAEGNLVSILSQVLDVTGRKNDEDHLRDQAKILSVITDAIIVVDKSFRIKSWNDRAEELYGWKEEDVLGEAAKDILRSEFIGTGRTEATRQLELGESIHTESVQYTKDEKKIFVKGYTVPLRDSSGTITGYVAVNHDITGRKLADAQKEFHATVMETMHDAVIATDEEFHITAWNSAAERMYGWSEKEVLGKNSRDILRGTMSENDVKKLVSDLAAMGSANYETTQHRKDGTAIIIESRLAEIRHNQGNITYVAANRDITGRKEAESIYENNDHPGEYYGHVLFSG